MNKGELRNVFLEKRKLLSAETIEKLSRSIADIFFDSFDLDTIGTLHCFIPIKKFNEVNTSPIYKRVWNEFSRIRTVAPRIEDNSLQNFSFNQDTKFVENSWGVSEPVDGVPIGPNDIDVVIVPLLCFDANGFRVGYGKGFYDRFLAQCRPDCLRVGLSLFPPVDRIDDIDEFDISLDRCVTPDKIFDFRK